MHCPNLRLKNKNTPVYGVFQAIESIRRSDFSSQLHLSGETEIALPDFVRPEQSTVIFSHQSGDKKTVTAEVVGKDSHHAGSNGSLFDHLRREEIL